MEPQLPTPNFGPEATPQTVPQKQGGEVFKMPQYTPEHPGAPIEQGKETRETFSDGSSADPAAVQAVSPPPLPVIQPAQPTITQPDPVADDTPVAAADEDLIEREWVEKAKKVVAETRNDPYAQDQAVGRPQADYLQKRYGKTIKPSRDG
ncbi:MAG TPA: hypothetical protein PKD68_02795 [Candidatus Saccharibacteria bacterium]|nr:hypothetical protein [Candidatus Saccharibacteria bacterium]